MSFLDKVKPTAKPDPFSTKKPGIKAVTVEEEQVKPTNKPAPKIGPKMPKPTLKVEVAKEVVKEEPKVNVEVKEEPKPKRPSPSFVKNSVDKKEVKVEETKEIKEVKAENTNEETKGKKATAKKAATTKKTTTKKEEKKELDEKEIEEEATLTSEQLEVINELFKMPYTSIKYSEVILALRNPNMIDEEWEGKQKALLAEDDEIEIESDMQENDVKRVSSQLAALRRKVWYDLNHFKCIMDSLSNKDTEGIIERIKYINSNGSNDAIRRKNGIMAVMSYKDDDGNIINYYEIYEETKRRFMFLKGLLESIQYKTNLLNTNIGALKTEKNQNIYN